ncbi:MAG: hypothetical protein PHH59_16000 [Methylovulum sp.]|uniref:hypothetical protein n=1 Tax=Methylovulum sp. TaxID=1916980 RepID=UPI00263529EB|nr:hypothetical protein [Methylovulum sp.]MDD2725510.1 hypothetical protein [Methylovulum sp.]MDD5126106.1 hypothetical protein [Methylovulum sp.]
MITKEQLKDEINTVEDPQILELLYQLLLKIKHGNIPQKQTLTNWLLENMQGLGNLSLPDRNETDREIDVDE